MNRSIRLFTIIICLGTALYSFSQTNNKYLKRVGIVDNLHSEILDESRELYVQLPVSYDPENAEKYPVVFILDGEILMSYLSAAYDNYYGGFMPEMVLVGINNGKHRTRDLTPTQIDTKYGMPFNEENGKSDKFLGFIETELIPYLEQKYPITNYRTLIGHSYGGLFTISTLLNRPELFANYLAIDPSLDWDNQVLLKEAKSFITTKDFSSKSLFISLGGQLHMQRPEITIENVMEDDTDFTIFARSNIEFSEIIKESELTTFWKFYPRELHGTIPLPSIMDGLISLFEWYQMENTSLFNSPETSKDALYKVIHNRENKLRSHFGYSVPPYPEDLLNMSGYMYMDMEQLDKSKMFFELAITYYPESANSYDSMADYYEAQGDKTNALKYVTKAFEISGDDYHKERMEQLK